MNHQPYTDWLFTGDMAGEDVLSPRQKAELQEHLQSCTPCRSMSDAWQMTERHLRGQDLTEPRSGFISRWEARLETDRKRAHRRQSGAMLAVCTGGAAVILIVLAILTWPWLRSPGLLLWTWIYHLFTIYSFVELARDIFGNLLRTATIAVPITWLIVLVGLISELGVLWIVSFRLLTNPRRIIR